MASNKMLIDASHPEETRVVVVRGNKVEEFDFESENKKQIRGNIYLAKVTRVEPSLQAAFVDYGGNRHGFLAFSEIHPDYYQIPVADRLALLEAEAAISRQQNDDDDDEIEAKPEKKRTRRRRSRSSVPKEEAKPDTDTSADADISADAETGEETSADSTDVVVADEPTDASFDEAASVDTKSDGQAAELSETAPDDDTNGNTAESDDDGDDDLPPKTMAAENETDVISEAAAPKTDAESEQTDNAQDTENAGESATLQGESGESKTAEPASAEAESDTSETEEQPAKRRRTRRKRRPRAEKAASEEAEADAPEETSPEDDDNDDGDEEAIESLGAEDAMDEVVVRRAPRRHYKIQEVIKRRQIILIQVAKEERGNKGAALTTYLSLAGRYSVLMPNTARGGGISRKITNVTDRKRLKAIASDLDVAEGMGVILRTAGASRTKAEITRDFEYLLRLWENVRNLTLKSTAPCLVYEEGSLVKRSIRDLYNKDISEILVSGDEAYTEAHDFMGMLMPSHAKNVRHYRDNLPIFTKCGVESQLDKMFQPQVTLKSGGYLVINQTEALVAIDVNSGRSTRQHSIEETALQTNLEASDEVARQLRLRDLAGLIVIDYIDMEEKRNNRSVEKRLKDALKNDRARIQIGRISHFGLMEMSRQRMRASVLESTTLTCPTCEGIGHVRAPSSIALHVLRSIEEYLLKNSRHNITVNTTNATAFYILSHKRSSLDDLEKHFGVSITFESDRSVGSQYLRIERGELAVRRVQVETHVQPDTILPDYDDDQTEVEPDASTEVEAESNSEQPKRKRRRRRSRGGRDDNNTSDATEASEEADTSAEQPVTSDDETESPAPKRRRRGKRGGRPKPEDSGAETGSNEMDDHNEPVAESASPDAPEVSAQPGETSHDDAPRKPRRNTRRPRKMAKSEDPVEEASSPVEEPAIGSTDAASENDAPPVEAEAEEAPKPKRRRTRRKKVEDAPVEAEAPAVEVEAPTEVSAEPAADEPAKEQPAADTRPARPRRNTRRVKAEATPVATVAEEAEPQETPVVEETGSDEADDKSKKGGWWQRRSFFR